jgi:hypothetical protein
VVCSQNTEEGVPAVAGEANARRVARRAARRERLRRFISAVRDSDLAAVEETVLRLSRSRPWLAPLALGVGALTILFEGLRLLVINWRLTLIQMLPAVWIWVAMLDLKALSCTANRFTR